MLKIAWRNIIHNPLTSLLSAVLFAISIVIIILLSLVGHQLDEKFSASKKRVNLVVGAPGSEMDLILSSIYHISPPVQNIKIKDAAFVLADPSVKAVPLAMGDHWAEDGGASHNAEVQRRRIVGTDTSYLSLYDAKIDEGRIWDTTMEVVIGAEVHSLGLDIGDKFAGVHGLVGGGADAHVHEDQLYTVVGILEGTGTVLDQLILCNIQSVWAVHEGHGHGEDDTPVQIAGPKYTQVETPERSQYRLLSAQEKDSLHLVIKEKASNLTKFNDFDSYTLKSPTDSLDKFNNQLLRLRSNVKSIIATSALLNASDITAISEDHENGASISVQDSIPMALKAGYEEIGRLVDLCNNVDLSPSEMLKHAQRIEVLTHELMNAYKLLEHDANMQARRKMMEARGVKIKRHYLFDYMDKEITSILVTFKDGAGGFRLVGRIKEDYQNKLGLALVDAQVSQLFSIIEPAVDYLTLLAYIIMSISGISILISLLKSLRERKYEMALMRVMGATRIKIFSLVIIEGIILSILGFILGFVLAHLLGEVMSNYLEAEYHYKFSGFIVLKSELYVLLGTIGIGIASAILPAILAMRTNISSTLSNK